MVVLKIRINFSNRISILNIRINLLLRTYLSYINDLDSIRYDASIIMFDILKKRTSRT